MPLYWTQFVAHTNEQSMQSGLEARVQDPLWLLHRQWQLGEFHGEDAGTPIRVDVERDAFVPDQVVIAGQARPYLPEAAPLEAVVEAETPEQVGPDVRTRAQLGLRFLQRLERRGLPFDRQALVTSFGFPASELAGELEPSAAARVLMRRAPDGGMLAQHLSALQLTDSELAALFPQASPAQYPAYREAITGWLAEYRARTGVPGQGDAWLEERLEYGFGLSIPTDVGRVELRSPEYHGGRLDWDAFRIAAVEAASPVAPQRETLSLLPMPVTFRGMPAPRFWQLEDAAVDFGNPEAAERDVGRLLLAEFVMAWGNDWFLVPVEVPMGSLARIQELRVTDTFGLTTRILPQYRHSPTWGMNRLSRAVSTSSLDGFLWVPPVLPTSLQGANLEEVLFLRDELANVAWAIERFVADGLGEPRAVLEGSAPPPGVATGTGGGLRYQVMTDLPEHWIPLVPVRDMVTQERFLVRAGLLDEVGEEPPRPLGEILGASELFRVHEEELPRDGAQVSRAYQLARWYGGGRVLWVGRRKHAGVGELRSHLEFDALLRSA